MIWIRCGKNGIIQMERQRKQHNAHCTNTPPNLLLLQIGLALLSKIVRKSKFKIPKKFAMIDILDISEINSLYN